MHNWHYPKAEPCPPLFTTKQQQQQEQQQNNNNNIINIINSIIIVNIIIIKIIKNLKKKKSQKNEKNEKNEKMKKNINFGAWLLKKNKKNDGLIRVVSSIQKVTVFFKIRFLFFLSLF